MMKPHIERLPFTSLETLFERVKHLPYSVWLDSSDTNSPWSRYSILATQPFATMTTFHGVTSLQTEETSTENPLTILEKTIDTYRVETPTPFPFIGGAIGYMSYEASTYCIPTDTPFHTNKIPEIVIGFYDKSIVYDHKTQTTHFIQLPITPIATSFNEYINSMPVTPPQNDLTINTPTSLVSKDSYVDMIQKTQHHIREGDIYQANISYPYHAHYDGDISHLYRTCRNISPAPYSCYFKTPDTTLLSSSPERFFQVTNGHIQARPIKGTIPRGKTHTEDKKLQQTLLQSEKDKAELLMITDLLRNDIGKVATPQSVIVPELFTLEKYSHVSHLVSTIEGDLAKNTSLSDVISSLFPGGSITGAPKYKAIEIINTIEEHPRECYTGAIGYWGFDGQSDINIAIRTCYTHNNTLYFHTGGGITIDSDPESEWHETKAKAEGFLQSIETHTKKQVHNNIYIE